MKFESQWRLLWTPPAPGAWNMAVDEAILRGVEEGSSLPTFRLYSWEPSCVTLGFAQKAEQELQLERLKADGIDVVRRFTGGRAVYHSNEITYGVIGPICPKDLQADHWSRSLGSTYHFIGEALARGLRSLGGQVDLERGDHTEKFAKGMANRPCFASTSKSELVLDGRKLAGSAQRRTHSAFLQHGALLRGPEHLRLADYLDLDEWTRVAYVDQLKAHSISLADAGLFPTDALLRGALFEGWKAQVESVGESCGDAGPLDGEFTALELQRIQEFLPKYTALSLSGTNQV
jgi:lipoate-protein ligase A